MNTHKTNTVDDLFSDLDNLGEGLTVLDICRTCGHRTRTILPPNKDDLFYALDPESRENDAEEKDCDMIFPLDDELQLDLDTPEQMKIYKAALVSMPQGVIKTIRTTDSIQDGHKHVYLKLSRKFTVLERIALQFMLGSDPMRESLGALRVLLEIPNPVCLFEKRPK